MLDNSNVADALGGNDLIVAVADAQLFPGQIEGHFDALTDLDRNALPCDEQLLGHCLFSAATWKLR